MKLYKFVAGRLITLGFSSWVVTHLKHNGSHKIVGTGSTLTIMASFAGVNDMLRSCKLHVAGAYKQ